MLAASSIFVVARLGRPCSQSCLLSTSILPSSYSTTSLLTKSTSAISIPLFSPSPRSWNASFQFLTYLKPSLMNNFLCNGRRYAVRPSAALWLALFSVTAVVRHSSIFPFARGITAISTLTFGCPPVLSTLRSRSVSASPGWSFSPVQSLRKASLRLFISERRRIVCRSSTTTVSTSSSCS